MRLLETKADEIFAAREAAVPTILAVVIADTVAVMFTWRVLFHTATLGWISHTTGGYLGGTLIGSLFALAVMLVIACGLDRLRLRDFGITLRGWLIGVALVLALWLLTEVTETIVLAATGTPLTLSAELSSQLPQMVGQIFGNTLGEEIMYRGFLFVQLVVLARRFTTPRRGFVIGLISSQLIFALSHIPSRLANGITGYELVGNLTAVFWFGVMYALLYVRTGNLAACMGLHALSNIALELFAHGAELRVPYELIVFVLWPLVMPRTVAR